MSDDINVGQLSEQINNKVDLNCNNIDSNGQKHFDGQWVAKSVTLSTDTAVGTYTIDLGPDGLDYLPDDNYNYEVIIVYQIGTKSTGDILATKVYSDLVNIQPCYISQKSFSTSATQYNGCFLVLPVSKYLYLEISVLAAANTECCAAAYRRIGVNS